MKRPTQLTEEVLVEELSQLVLGYLGVRPRKVPLGRAARGRPKAG